MRTSFFEKTTCLLFFPYLCFTEPTNTMQTANFKDWTLTTLEDAFGLKQIFAPHCALLQSWQGLAQTQSIDDHERRILLDLQAPLSRGGRAWNEVELENKFISPVMMAAKIDDEQIGYFLERSMKAVVGDYELSGIVDGVIATGFRDPKKPFFCMHEYKKSIENQGSPDAQALAAMLVARELNGNEKPIYGMFIIGFIWNFVVLNGNEYCISVDYKAGDEEVFDIFRMLKALKVIILRDLVGQAQ